MITELRVKNYRSFAEETAQFERLTVLVGRNAVGKSNLVDALQFVRDALQSGLDIAISKRGGMSALRRWSGKGRPYSVEVSLRLDLDGLAAGYRFTLASATRGNYRIKEEVCEFYDVDTGEIDSAFEVKEGRWVSGPETIRKAETQSRALTLPLLTGVAPFDEVYAFLTEMSFYTIMPELLLEPQVLSTPYPLDEQAANLASVLREMKAKRPETARALEDSLSRMVDGVSGFRVQQVGSYLVTRLRHQGAEEGRSPSFELFQESDGTLRLLGILTALYQVPPRSLIALEEPELTIHPGALAVLWEELRRTSQKSQLLITTHSPDLLDLCDADMLRIVEKEAGISHVGPVDAAQKEIIRDRLLSPGQLMRGQGLYRMEPA